MCRSLGGVFGLISLVLLIFIGGCAKDQIQANTSQSANIANIAAAEQRRLEQQSVHQPKDKALNEADALNKQVIALMQEGKPADAVPLAERALAIREHFLGQKHADTATSLNNLAELYRIQGQYSKAESFCKRALAIREQIFSPDSPDIAGSLNNLAVIYYNQGQYALAEPLYQRILTMLEQAKNPNNTDIATGLNNLAELYRVQGQYARAEPIYQRALKIREASSGPDSQDVSNSLNSLGLLYYNQGLYDRAEPLYQRALSIQEKTLGSEHPSMAIIINNLASLYENQGQYARAEALFQRTLKILEHAFGPDHPYVATSLGNLAEIYRVQGKYEQAESMLKRALSVREQALGPEHPDVALSLNNLAELYRSKEEYILAEPLYQRALAILEKVFGNDHPSVATSLSNLALLYRAQGQYDRAEPLLRSALTIREKALGPYHPDVATILSNLAALYSSHGEYSQSEPLYKRALAIDEKAFGASHENAATDLNNLGETYRIQGQYNLAEPLYRRALVAYEKNLGTAHPLVSNCLNNLALLYNDQGQYAKALPLYERALTIREHSLGPDSLDVAVSLNNLAGLYENQGNYTKALEFARRATRIYRDRIFANSHAVSSSAEGERSQFKDVFGVYLSIAAARLGENSDLLDELVGESFEIGQLFHDGSVGDALAHMAARFAAGSGELAILARKKEDVQLMWQKASDGLVAALGKPTGEQNTALIQELRQREKKLHVELTNLNIQLNQQFPDYAELTAPRPVTLREAQKLLNSGEALVAYVLGKSKSFVWLITEDTASFRRIDRTQNDIMKDVQALRAKLSPDSNPDMAPFPVAIARTLYQDILGQETTRLADIKTLFIAADGALESLPFAVLVTDAPTGPVTDYKKIPWLSRKWATATLPTVSSLRALRTLVSKDQIAAQPFIGFGDPDFSGGAVGKQRGLGTMALTRGELADTTLLRSALAELPETADELKAIAKILDAGPNTIFLRDNATVPTVIATPLSQYRVIEFATHALVAGDLERLMLQGAEPAIVLTPPPVATAGNDGLLRTSQVAQLKLNADWVVLSACNTAAPDGTPNADGLSGLAKAFFYAGAKAMLVSHWSVLSKPAVEITTGMFREWQVHPDAGRAEALRVAEMSVLDRSADPAFSHPQAWAPFIVAGEGGSAR